MLDARSGDAEYAAATPTVKMPKVRSLMHIPAVHDTHFDRVPTTDIVLESCSTAGDLLGCKCSRVSSSGDEAFNFAASFGIEESSEDWGDRHRLTHDFTGSMSDDLDTVPELDLDDAKVEQLHEHLLHGWDDLEPDDLNAFAFLDEMAAIALADSTGHGLIHGGGDSATLDGLENGTFTSTPKDIKMLCGPQSCAADSPSCSLQPDPKPPAYPVPLNKFHRQHHKREVCSSLLGAGCQQMITMGSNRETRIQPDSTEHVVSANQLIIAGKVPATLEAKLPCGSASAAVAALRRAGGNHRPVTKEAAVPQQQRQHQPTPSVPTAPKPKKAAPGRTYISPGPASLPCTGLFAAP